MKMRSRVCLFAACSIFALFSGTTAEKFKVIREWNYLNFTWPNEETYRSFISKGDYVPQNNIISGIKHFDDHFYLTLPRMKSGVPTTLARIPAGIVRDTAPALEPFPSWEMNSMGDCGALQNVQNVEIDSKGQLWIIDSGRTETMDDTPNSRCRPKLIVFDIKKNLTTTAYTFPDAVADANSNFLYDIVVDDTDGGYAYITDNSGKDPGIIVFSVKDHHSWKIRHAQSMKADPTASVFNVNGILVKSPINIAGMALGPKLRNFTNKLVITDDRDLYFSPLSSLHLYSINTSVLRNEQNGVGEYQGEVMDYGLKGSQSVGMIMDNKGVLYYSLLSTNSIARWDSHTSFEKNQRIIARDQRYLEWPNSFTFDQTGNITVLVNRLDKFIYDSFDLSEPNFRLITSYVGSKSYIYDQENQYESSSTMSSVSNAAMTPPSSQTPMSEPKAEPEPTPEPSSDHSHDHDHHDHEGHDHDHHVQGNVTEAQPTSSSSTVSATVFISAVFVILHYCV